MGTTSTEGKVFALHMITMWHNKVQIYKDYLLVFIPTMLNFAASSNRQTVNVFLFFNSVFFKFLLQQKL